MDLNASPLPEDDEQQPYEEAVEVEMLRRSTSSPLSRQCAGSVKRDAGN